VQIAVTEQRQPVDDERGKRCQRQRLVGDAQLGPVRATEMLAISSAAMPAARLAIQNRCGPVATARASLTAGVTVLIPVSMQDTLAGGTEAALTGR